MRLHRAGVATLWIAVCCVGLGFAFLMSASVDPVIHRDFERSLVQLETVDTRFNQDVLRARQGSLGHYDGIVEDVRQLGRIRRSVSEPPLFIDDRGRAEYTAALERYRAAAREKELHAERFKSTNAALRNSLVYFPLAAADLLAAASASPVVEDPAQELRVAVLQFVVSHSDADRQLAVRALSRVSRIDEKEPSTARLLENARIHARNILTRGPRLDELTDRIIGAPTPALVRTLRETYAQAAQRAAEGAHLYRRLLYLCAVALLASIAWAFSELGDAKQKLEASNAELDQRVRERTSELEDLNEELEDSRKQQLELKDRFLSHVSHELRTPLAAVQQFVEILLDGVAGEITDEQRGYLDLAFKNVRQLEAMISDLMEVTRARAGKLRVEVRPTDVAPLLDEFARAFDSRARGQGIALSIHLERDLPRVLADSTRLRQVLNNLVENAFKFTAAEGRIEIRAEADPETTGRVRLSVTDTGCGIPQEQRAKIFDRLHQVSIEDSTTRAGLGLGLSISRELVERMDGRIDVDSELGRGSTFRLTLPNYSVANLVRPAVLEAGRPRAQYGILRIRLGSGAGATVDGARRRIAEKLRGLARRESDVLLPSDGENDLFLVAPTDAAGIEALGERIRFGLSDEAALDGQEVAVHTRLERVSRKLMDETDAALADVARNIERLIDDPSAWAA